MKIENVPVRVALALSFALLSTLVSLGQEVRYNYMPGTDFSVYKTYKWVVAPDHEYPDQIIDAQIKQSIDKQLTLKGLSRSAVDDADLYVTYQVAIAQQTQWNAYGGGGWRIGMGSVSASSSTINIGTLVIDLYDSKARLQVWTGSATKQLNPSKDPEKNQKNLEKAMAKLLKNYPPPKKK